MTPVVKDADPVADRDSGGATGVGRSTVKCPVSPWPLRYAKSGLADADKAILAEKETQQHGLARD